MKFSLLHKVTMLYRNVLQEEGNFSLTFTVMHNSLRGDNVSSILPSRLYTKCGYL